MITQTLYYIFIYPMQILLGSVFEWLYGITHSYGWSIVLLSLLINVFLLKLTNLSESKARAISALKAVCDTKIAEFKKVFKGAELHAYTQTLFKQKHYHPIYNLASLGGLALQIPFFLGVLFLLQDFEGLEGTDFGIIGDLSKPDTLLFGYALLPFVMSILSLVNVFVSSKELGARIQGGLIALIFLVLLYAMPSALVLYWTMSMVFWLARTLWRHSAFSDKSLILRLRLGHHRLGSSRHPSLENNDFSSKILECQQSNSDSVARSESSHTDSVTITESKRALDSETPTQTASNVAGFAMRNWDFSSGVEGATLSGSDRTQQKKKHDLSRKANARSILYNIFTPYKDLDSKTYLTYRNISIFALLNIFFLIFVFSPFAVYSSDVSQFDPSQTFQTLGGLFGFFLLFSFLGIYTTSFFYKTRLLKLGVYGVSVILCIGLVYTFVLNYIAATGEAYPAMENMMFLTTQGMFHKANKFIDLFVGCSLCLVVFAIFIKLRKYFLIFLKLVFISFVCSSVVYGYISAPKPETFKRDSQQKNEEQIFTNPNENLSNFSKDNLNIVVLMLDAFTGSHLKILLEQNPNLQYQLDGFVYYDNTTTASSFTFTSLPSVFGGDYYSAYQINRRMPESLNNERAMAIVNISNAFLAKGFQVGVDVYTIDKDFVNANIIPHYADNFKFTREDAYFIKLFEQNHNFNLSALREASKHNFMLDSFIAYGLFRFSPYVIRGRVLNIEALVWNIQFGATKSSLASINSATQHIAQLSYLADTAKIDTANKPTIKFISNLTSHDSFVLSIDTCKPDIYLNPQLPEFYRDVIPKLFWGKYNSEVCAFREITRFIDKLKKLEVYDNTLFIIVSDHGRDDSYPQLKLVGKNKFPGCYTDTLLLIKQPNTRGELTLDSQLMINSDIAGIVCHHIGGCPNVASSVLVDYPKNREVIHFYPEYFEGHKHPKTHYTMHSLWKVTDNIYNPANWQDITNTESKER